MLERDIKNPSDSLQKWIETGFSSSAVAAYGTSLEHLSRILSSGEISPTDVPIEELTLTYADVNESKDLLYFATPLISSLAHTRPELYAEIVGKFGESADNADRALSDNEVRRMSASFARKHSIRHFFNEAFGSNLEHFEVALIGKLFGVEDRFFDRLVNNWADGMAYEAVGNIFRNYESAQIESVVKTSSKRFGVIIYYNNAIFNNTVEAGRESEQDLLIITKKPITIDVISGIEMLSEKDWSDLQAW